MLLYAVHSDPSAPLASGRKDAAVWVDATGEVSVPHRFDTVCHPEVCPAVVELVSVAVVNIRRGILSGHPLPDDAVGHVNDPVDSDAMVFSAAPGWFAFAMTELPRQLPGFNSVIETVVQAFVGRQWSGAGRIVFGHRTVLAVRGQVAGPVFAHWPRCAF